MLPLRDHVPTRTFPFVNYALIAANVAAFVWEQGVFAMGVPEGQLVDAYGLVPAHAMIDPAYGVVAALTAMFLHASWLHLGGNMLFLWIFGDNVEDALGHARYGAFYLLSGLAAAFAQIATGPGSMIPMVGASGAIAGVLAAYAVLYPKAPVTVLNPIPILWLFLGLFWTFPAWLVIAEFFLVNLFNGLGTLAGPETGGVAFMAHVGGFVFGLFAVRYFMRGRGKQEHDAWNGWRPPRVRVVRPVRPDDPYYSRRDAL